MFSRGSATAKPGRPTIRRGPRVGSVCDSHGVRVVLCVPEESAVKRWPILGGVIDVNVNDMPSQLVCKLELATIAAPGVLDDGTVDHIVLVVVMGYQRMEARVANCLVIGV